MKRAETVTGDDRFRVWRPASIPGLEVAVKWSPMGLEFPTAPVFDHRVVVNGPGRAVIRSGHDSVRVTDTADLVLLQHPGSSFGGSFEHDGGTGGACLGLSPELVGTLLSDGGPVHLHWDHIVPDQRWQAAVSGRARAALDVIRHHRPLLEQQHHLVALAEVIAHTSTTSVRRGDVGPVRPREHRAVREVRERLGSEPGGEHSLPDLAAATGLNPRYLIRVFAEHTGLTPHRYLTAVRVERAKRSLAEGCSNAAVAGDLGFADQAHFTRVFRRYVKVTPGRFRTLSVAASPR